ncbi:MAG: hypothetical protein IKR13_02745 [Victivallales bacterium]|nr:hypothetical protein [Victivallales bacterium]
MKQVISLIITTLCVAVFAKSPDLVERASSPSGDFEIHVNAPPIETKLPYDETVPLIVELLFPANASYQSLDLDFDELPCFDCDVPQPSPDQTFTEDNRKSVQLQYQLEPLQPPYEIPAITATFQDAGGNPVTIITNNSFTLNIADEAPTEELDDSYLEPVDPPGWNREKLRRILPWLGGILLVLVLLGGSLWRILQNRRANASPPPTPYEIADRALTALLAEKLPENGEYKRFYERISGILREYLENRFDVKAPRLTTEEFLRLLTSTPELVREHRELLQKFLTACDMVKFAAQVPDSPEVNEITTSCRTFLDSTQPPTTESDKQFNPLLSNK